MTSRRIRTRHPHISGRMTRAMPATRAASPCSAPDDSGAFCFADAHYQHQSGRVLLGKRESSAGEQQFTAEASRPCFCWMGGLERCDACKGRGCSEDRDTCDHCLGMGYSNCDFCGGSVLVTCDSITPERRVSV